MMLYIRRLDTGDIVKAMPCSAVIGTSNYGRALRGLYAQVNLDKFYIDHHEADQEHERIRLEGRHGTT